MPGLDANTLKCVMTGTTESADTWSCAIWLLVGAGSSVTGDNITAIATAIEPTFNTYAQWAGNHVWSSAINYNGVSVYYYPDGSTVSTLVGRADVTPRVGSQTKVFPSFIAMVQSLRSPFSGRSQRGRIYLPVDAGGVAGNGQFTTDLCESAADATAALLTGLNGLDLSAHGVASQGATVASFTKGGVAVITHVIVDSLPDVQHRRQNKQHPAFELIRTVTT